MSEPTQQFVDNIRALGAAYNRTVDEPILYAFWLAVCDLPESFVTEAAVKCIRSDAKFMPRPGELRRMAQEYQPKKYWTGSQRIEKAEPDKLKHWQALLTKRTGGDSARTE